MKKITPIFAIISVFTFAFCIYVSGSDAGQKNSLSEKTLKAQHSDLTCFDCHLEEKPTSSLGVTCSNCHGTAADVAKLTESKYKEHYNPHNPLHYGTNALCENCHREHEPSRLECNNPFCHTEFKYQTP